MDTKLTGKATIIFGGTAGIGLAAAKAFASEGARVVIVGRDRDRGEAAAASVREGGAECVFERGDIANAEDVEAAVARTVTRFGRLDCAFNNAATLDGLIKRLVDFDDAEWDQSMAANLRGIFFCLRAELRQMLRQEPKGGSIVCSSSVNGLGGWPLAGPYCVAKTGILSLIKTAALEHALDNIRVNGIAFGPFETELLGLVMERVGSVHGMDLEKVRSAYIEKVPLGRIAKPEEAGDVVVWLCSSAASYVTGHTMIVDGGMTSFAR
jgi:NAD(P)-dependent dehydrogenase (short-subunit alcohol dehydrogenase family)